MNILILHDAVGGDDAPDVQDALIQAEAVEAALAQLGHSAMRLAVSLNLASMHAQIQRLQPDCIFNLVESLHGKGRLIHLVPATLDAFGVPFSGCGDQALWLSSNKVLAKTWMKQAAIPTPVWIEQHTCHPVEHDGAWIIKSIWEHASIGLDAASIIPACSSQRIRKHLREIEAIKGPSFAEQFIDGREFNLSLLADAEGVQVLPAAEIVFDAFPAHMPRIVDYAAKWDEQSFAYQHTRRYFPQGAEDATLLNELNDLARRCWQVFFLRGYARVDFRIDHLGRPWVLEVNANPCLSPDAGFAAALEQAKIPFNEAIRRILLDCSGVKKENG